MCVFVCVLTLNAAQSVKVISLIQRHKQACLSINNTAIAHLFSSPTQAPPLRPEPQISSLAVPVDVEDLPPVPKNSVRIFFHGADC